jgi:hypothetical protein
MGIMWEALRADRLVALVRFVGVVVGIWGIYLTAPEAWRDLRRRVVGTLREQYQQDRAALRERMSRLVDLGRRLLRRPINITAYPEPIESAQSIGDNVTSTATEAAEVWSPQVDGQIEILRARIANLAAEVGELRVQQAQGINDLRMALAATADEQAEKLDALRTEQRRKEAALLDINVRGLPLVGVSILLSGLPDPLVRWWPAATLLLAIAILLVLGVGFGRPRTETPVTES